MTTRINPFEAVLSTSEPVLDLPLDHRRILGRLSDRPSELPFSMGADLVRRLGSLAEQEGVSLSTVCFAGYAILLSRYAHTPEVNIRLSSIARRNSRLGERSADYENVAVVPTNCLPALRLREFLRIVAESVAAGEQSARNHAAAAPGAVFCQTGFTWEHVPRSKLRTLPGHQDGFDVSLRFQELEDAVQPAFTYRPELFERATIERMARHLVCLFEAMVDCPEASLSGLDMMPADERALVLGCYSGSDTPFPQVCLHQLFSEQVVLRPDAEALVFGAERLTYQQLDQRSNQVAHFLLSEGICPEDRVGIFMDRSADMIVSILGTLKAGGTYVPIDPDYPAERLQFIAEDTAVRWVLTQHCVRAVLPATAPSIFVDGTDSPIRAFSNEPVPNRSSPESIAVVIYTSGSTGQPKAARIPHRAAVRTVRDTNYVQILPEDRVAQACSPSFDAAIKEIWLALVNGAALVGLRRECLLSPAELTHLLRTERISVLILNTSYVHQIARDTPEILNGVRKVFFGGEAAEPAPLRELLKYVGPGVLVNGYGPAEGCVITTYHEITSVPGDATTIPIGRPVSNARLYLLDELRRPVPIGVQGEIYIGGAGVARGYLNRPELTAERFVADTFSSQGGKLLYRTGDLARMRGGGELVFLGRADNQVKIRGHRIELAEVAQVIAAHQAVKQVFLMVREDNPGDKRLTAYVTLRTALPAPQESLLRHAKEKLPAHMLPATFIVLDSIPLTTNGKVDSKALPAPFHRPELASSYQAAGNGFEAKLTHAWQDLLRVDHIGVNDNFFDLGGHSLLAARLIARIEKETGQNIPVATLFESPTIALLAKRLRERSYASAWSPLVKLYAPDQPTLMEPFFCVHSLGANLISYRKIASFLRGDRPVYGLQPHGLDGKLKPFETMEAMASAYVSEIRQIQPQGPYYLGGVCIGGVIAYEIAQQLQTAGQEVAIVVLIDSFLPGELRYLNARPALTEYLDWHFGEMLLLPAFARPKYLANWLANGGVRLGEALGWGDNSSLARASRTVAAAHRRATLSYKPKPYAGKVMQLMCSDASHRAYEDRRLAWSSLASSGFEIRIIPGNHLTMVETPHARVLAEELQRGIDRAPGLKNSSSGKTEGKHSAGARLDAQAILAEQHPLAVSH